MDIKQITESFNKIFVDIETDPAQANIQQNHEDQELLPKDWHISYHYDTETDQDLYYVFWRQVLLSKIKVPRDGSKKTVKKYEDGIKLCINFNSIRYRSQAA
ncbi:MAG: hypothetical protein CFH44_01050 [Proteobacteria bacterium]|nr:MAG: hypothetical protein CFH44_01050 [Pseudomonadota bacterium]|tara:strand:+ start:159 stop:464 length:306 start_codon:yes stop_codon:yes gene_type:complete